VISLKLASGNPWRRLNLKEKEAPVKGFAVVRVPRHSKPQPDPLRRAILADLGRPPR
jgi:hypothetical protein